MNALYKNARQELAVFEGEVVSTANDVLWVRNTQGQEVSFHLDLCEEFFRPGHAIHLVYRNVQGERIAIRADNGTTRGSCARQEYLLSIKGNAFGFFSGGLNCILRPAPVFCALIPGLNAFTLFGAVSNVFGNLGVGAQAFKALGVGFAVLGFLILQMTYKNPGTATVIMGLFSPTIAAFIAGGIAYPQWGEEMHNFAKTVDSLMDNVSEQPSTV